MALRIITWNMFYGKISGNPYPTPVDRFNHIMQIADSNTVDVVLLQEHPGASSTTYVNPAGHPQAGQLKNAQVPPNYTYTVFSEIDSTLQKYTNTASASNRAYAVLYRQASCTNVTTSHYESQAFTLMNNQGPWLRNPIETRLTHQSTNYYLFSWHNEVANYAQTAMKIFSDGIKNNPLPSSILAGDLNLTGSQMTQYLHNWNGITDKVDHVLCLKMPIVQVLANVLTFKSDHHFPMGADIN